MWRCECGEGMECGGESVVRVWSVEVRVWSVRC